jgi:hypothetical protein
MDPTRPELPVGTTSQERLDSWKEIAAYLRASVRTVQRWEREFGLPIHGRRRAKGEPVFAFRSELDAWYRGLAATDTLRSTGAETGRPVLETPEQPGPVGSGADGVTDALHQVHASTRAGEAAALAVPPSRTLWPWLGALGMVGLAILVAYAAWGRRGDVVRASWEMTTQSLTTWDAAGRRVWTKRFDEALDHSWYARERRMRGGPDVVVTDLDGDGRREILAVVKSLAPAEGVVNCYRGDAVLRFSYRPTGPVTCGSEVYTDSLFSVARLFVGTHGREPHVWVVSSHREFPTRAERLTPDGRVHTQVWLNGHVTALAELRRSDRTYLLLGGTSNDPAPDGTAALTMVEAGQGRVRVPALQKAYVCGPESAQAPIRYLKFPRLDLARVAGARAVVEQVLPRPDSRIDVVVSQGLGRTVKYVLDAELTVLDAAFEDNFVTAHAAFQQSGDVDHPLGTVEEEGLWDVLAWHEGMRVRVRPPSAGARVK